MSEKEVAGPGLWEQAMTALTRWGLGASVPLAEVIEAVADERPFDLPIHRTEAGYPNCSTCDGGGCYDCTDPA